MLANLYMNIFGCALQYCYIKFMLKVTKAWETIKNYDKKIKSKQKSYAKPFLHYESGDLAR